MSQPKGVSIFTNSFGVPIFRLHYSAHPDRDAAWVVSEKPKYSDSMWRQEQEIDFSAAGGERVLRSLLEERWERIVITDPAWQPDPNWRYAGAVDYGKAHPCAYLVNARDYEGTRYALCEHYRSELTPREHMPHIRSLRLPAFAESAGRLPALPKCLWNFADPSMGYLNVAQEDRFSSYVQLFQAAGMLRIQLGQRGRDLRLVDEIRDAWSQPEPTFKIVLRCDGPKDFASLCKREGTYEDGCPNLLWELANIRRKEQSPSRFEQVGGAEGLVDRDNDAWDALKYWWLSEDVSPKPTVEQKWRQRVDTLRAKHPAMDLNTLIALRARFVRENKSAEVKSWR